MKSINFELSCDEEPCDLLEVHYQRDEWVMLKIKWLAGSSNESKSHWVMLTAPKARHLGQMLLQAADDMENEP